MKDPLFQARDDWWNNACLNFIADGWDLYAVGYKDAADILVREATEKSNPIAFLYRHYLELRLKDIIVTGQKLLDSPEDLEHIHGLAALWERCRAIFEEVWPGSRAEDVEFITDCIHEFSKRDPQSMSFRYPVTKRGDMTLPGLKHANVQYLHYVINRCAELLDGASMGLKAYLQDKYSDYYG